MPVFWRDGIAFEFIDRGAGRPFVFQHGLSADASQPSELLGEFAGVRVVALTCRAHGETKLTGDLAQLSLPAFADDVVALVRKLRLRRVICGGISMGAAVAVSLAVHAPDLVAALVLVRPAWLEAASPPNLAIYRLVARHLRQAGAAGLRNFIAEPEYATVAAMSPDNAASLRRQFEAPVPEIRAHLLEQIVASPTGVTRAAISGLAVPALVIGNREDPIHPLALARDLAGWLPQATFREVASKSVDPVRHVEEVRRAIGVFLVRLPATVEAP